MDRMQFIGVTAVILFVAFSLGWFAGWLVNRFTRVTQADIGELDRMAQALQVAEEERDQIAVYQQEQEEHLSNRLAQREAELRAAMEGLREARRESDDLRAYIERLNAEK